MRCPRLRLARIPVRRCMLVCCAALGVAVGGAQAVKAEIYRWRDGSGRLHFSQEIDKVPPAQREQARRGAVERKKRDLLQVYDAGGSSRASMPARRATLRSGRSVRIPFERQGTLRLTVWWSSSLPTILNNVFAGAYMRKGRSQNRESR